METIYQVWHHHGGESILLRETSFYSVAQMVIDFYLGTGTREIRKITTFAPNRFYYSSNEKTSPHYSCRNSIPNPDHAEEPGRTATQDTTDINVEFEANGWEGAIDADFTITGQPTE